MKNILFISYDGMTDPLGQSQVIPYLAGLTKYGYQFTILSCEKPGKYDLHKNYVEDILKPFPIKWVPILYHKNPPVLSSVYDVIMLKRKARQLHEKEKFDMVHTRPGVPALIGLWMKKKLGVKFLNDIREFYADSRVDGSMWNTKNIFYKWIYNFFKEKEQEAVAQSDGIVCLTYAAEKIIKEWVQYKKQTMVEVIPCSVDINLFDPAKIDIELKRRLKGGLKITDTDFIVSYLGSIGGWYLTDQMMQFCKILSDKIPAAKFLFISPHQHELIYETAERFGISREHIIVTHARRHEVPLLLSLSDYSVFFIKSCYSKKSSSPTKHGEIMAMGIPVITNSGVGDVAEIVEKYQSGIVLEELNEQAFLSASNFVLKESHFNKTSIRNGAIEFYNLEKAVEKYHSIYASIMG
ncbi:MAG: glycosyltransferase [Bacteroidota bacterium]|nr:glycosyltransferase [Bacteroidota bacterium]